MYHHQGELFVLRLFLSKVELEVPGGAGWCLNLVSRVKSGEIHLELVMIFPIEHHGLEPMTPENLIWQIRRSCLKGHAAGLDGSLHDHDKLKLFLGEVGGVEVEEG